MMLKNHKTLVTDLGVVVHLLTWAFLLFRLISLSEVSGIPVVPFEKLEAIDVISLLVFFPVTLALLIIWELALSKDATLKNYAKWVWGLSIALIPMAGVLFHCLHYRRKQGRPL
jgi:hypothetical protein